MIKPTSKASLKTQCLLISQGDVKKAEELYDFFAKDMEEMPIYDAPQPTWADNAKNVANGIFSFLGEHKGSLAQGYEIIRGFVNSKGGNLPSLGLGAPQNAPVPPLPPINE